MDILQAQLFYMITVAMLGSLVIGIVAVELKKMSVLVFNMAFGGLIGAIAGGYYLGVSGGLGGFNDFVMIILPWIVGPLAGFLGPGILKLRMPQFFRGISLPVNYSKVATGIWVMFIVSGLLATAIIFLPSDGVWIPGTGLEKSF